VSRDPMFLRFMWSTYCLPYFDYASQLWMPTGTPNMKNVENVQRTFLNMMTHFSETDSYWDRLVALRLYSIERRTERFKILYTWKAMEGLTPDFGLTVRSSPTTGRLCELTPLVTGVPESVKNLRLRSLQHSGPSLFNVLPAELRCVTGVCTATFKHQLDLYLSKLPDTPWLSDLTPAACHLISGKPTNSVLYLAPLHSGANRRLPG
jgi:hypothetical protein